MYLRLYMVLFELSIYFASIWGILYIFHCCSGYFYAFLTCKSPAFHYFYSSGALIWRFKLPFSFISLSFFLYFSFSLIYYFKFFCSISIILSHLIFFWVQNSSSDQRFLISLNFLICTNSSDYYVFSLSRNITNHLFYHFFVYWFTFLVFVFKKHQTVLAVFS